MASLFSPASVPAASPTIFSASTSRPLFLTTAASQDPQAELGEPAVWGTLHVLEAARTVGVRRVVVTSHRGGAGGQGKAAVAGAAAVAAAVAVMSPLSERLWREKAAVEFLGDVSARLAWRDLTVTVALDSGDMQIVLEGLTGHAKLGTITMLMGPFDSGKSTLLDALVGRLASNAFFSGEQCVLLCQATFWMGSTRFGWYAQ